jgi:putative endonuclease
MKRIERGQQGEHIAAQYLRHQGYRLQAQNYRCRQGEIDIIAWDGTTLVFVEVKTKSQLAFGAPQAMVDRRKQQKMLQVAMVYVQEHRLQQTNLRFDVVAVTCLPNASPEVTHLPAAFTATDRFLY